MSRLFFQKIFVILKIILINLRRFQMIHHYKNIHPTIHESAFVAKDAVMIGDVTIDAHASISFKRVSRGDVAPTYIGKRVNIHYLSMIHQSPGVRLSNEYDVTIGQQVTLQAVNTQRYALIDMDSLVLTGAELSVNAWLIAANLRPPDEKIPPHT